ncbi:MAG TPA: heme ABC transporter ATP-binding protein [Vicinamibacterales bacterium]
MVEARGLTYRVGGRTLVGDVTAAFAPGQLHLIIGPNGAGKSTLVKILSRLLRPAAGSVHYGGEDVSKASERDLARRRAVLSQAVEIAFPLSVREVVMMGRYPHFGGRAGPIDEAVCDEVMAFFDVTALADRSYPTLSGGEKQRVNFARVLAQVWRPIAGCRYLFLDEPLTFLDIRHQLDFMKRVKTFAAGADFVAVGVLHDLALAARFADQLVLIHEGRVLAAGSSQAVLTRENIQLAFQVEPVVVTSAATQVQHLIFE